MSTKQLRKNWRKTHREKWNELKKENYRTGAVQCHKKGLLWSKEEDIRILSDDRPNDRVLSLELGRSMQAIQFRRCKIRHAPSP